jgi:hypothetical protein
MVSFVGGFCRFVAALNYKEKQNQKKYGHEKNFPISDYSFLPIIM